jgi:hypothetical protein
MTISSVSMTLLISVQRNEPPINPFAPYAAIMPGQSHEAVWEQGFICRFNPGLPFNESCSLTPKTGAFAEIQVSITLDTGRVNRVVFLPRGNTQKRGDFLLGWGRPEVSRYSQTANLRWRNSHLVAIPQTVSDHLVPRLPISYAAFESTE